MLKLLYVFVYKHLVIWHHGGGYSFPGSSVLWVIMHKNILFILVPLDLVAGKVVLIFFFSSAINFLHFMCATKRRGVDWQHFSYTVQEKCHVKLFGWIKGLLVGRLKRVIYHSMVFLSWVSCCHVIVSISGQLSATLHYQALRSDSEGWTWPEPHKDV